MVVVPVGFSVDFIPDCLFPRECSKNRIAKRMASDG